MQYLNRYIFNYKSLSLFLYFSLLLNRHDASCTSDQLMDGSQFTSARAHQFK